MTQFTTDTLISKDGTKIGYRQIGTGAALILVHGGMMTSLNFTKLAEALADKYTVYVPDRRGRGMSGNYGTNYGIKKEVEDIEALVNKTGSKFIFGLSSGALISLQSALNVSSIAKLAIYEPPLLTDISNPAKWLPAYEKAMSKGNLGQAMMQVIKGTGDSWSMASLPGFILGWLFNLALKQETKPGEADLKAIIPTMHYDGILVKQMGGSLKTFKNLQKEVLLMGGTRSKGFLKSALEELQQTLPHSWKIVFPKIGHIAADNTGKPKEVAKELKRFFG